jgi:peptide/nickel transport system ATP-binding protein
VGLVGGSGSGKSTLARLVGRLERPDAGSIEIDGRDWLALEGEALRRARPVVQLVFQDPATSFDPRMRIERAIAEPLEVHRRFLPAEARLHAHRWMERCGLPRALGARLPGQLSGGQRQRVALARALALDPRVLLADEPLSALDSLIQRQVLELLATLQRETGVALLLIAHDLAAVEAVADRVVVLEHGQVVEEGTTRDVLHRPRHAATRALVAAVPRRPAAFRRGDPCHDSEHADRPVALSAREQPESSEETSGRAET